MSSSNKSMKQSTGSVSRRAVLASAVLAGMVPLSAVARQPSDATPPPTDATALGEASMPQWRFVLIDFVDQYSGTLTKPDGVPGGIRVVACQVILLNESDQPLEFTVTDFRLRDTDGVEYRGGEYLGSEPRIVSQNLPDGERTRGWLWFGIPETTAPASIVFVAPPPVLRISLG